MTESGAYAKLLEYGKEGLLFSSEITLKRVNFINRVLSVGKEEVLRVLFVDEKKGFIETNRLEEILTKMAKEVNVAPPAKEDIAKLIEEQDKDKTGKVDLNGFIPFFKLVSKSMAAALK